MVIAAVLVLSAIVLWLYYFWSIRKFYALARNLPVPSGLPFIGILHNVYKMSDALYKLTQYAAQLKTKTYFCWVGAHPLVYTMDPKLAETVLNSPDCLKKLAFYSVLSDVIGNGLITSGPPRWNHHRKLMTPIFKYKAIQDFFPDFNKFGHKLCEEFDALANSGGVFLFDIVMSTSLKSSVETTMGVDSNEKYDTKYLTHIERLRVMSIERLLKPWLSNSILFPFMSMYKPFKCSLAFIVQYVREIVDSKVILLNKNTITPNVTEVSEAIARSKHIFIDQIIQIQQRNELSLDDVIDHANTLLIAAFETIASTVFSTLLCLAMYPQYQEILFEEIVSVLPEEDADVTHADLGNLVYLDMCIKETMRVLAPFPLIGREMIHDFRVSKDILIPKGTQILIDIFNMQRDKDLWGPDAATFNPDHFLPANLENQHKYSYIPFSQGPRICIGWQYATWVTRVVLAQVLRKYRFSTKSRFEDLVVIYKGSLKYADEPQLEIHRR